MSSKQYRLNEPTNSWKYKFPSFPNITLKYYVKSIILFISIYFRAWSVKCKTKVVHNWKKIQKV